MFSDHEELGPGQLGELRADKNRKLGRNTRSEAVMTKNLLLAPQIEAIENDRKVVSGTYYGEILFDYLAIFYKKIGYSLNASHEQRERMRKAVQEGQLDRRTYKKFCAYNDSI